MNIISVAQRYYTDQGMSKIIIKEWSEKDAPCEIYFKPFTPADYEEIARLAGPGAGAAKEDVCHLVVKALNKNGARLFTDLQVDDLMQVSQRPIYNAVKQMLALHNKLVSDIAKN